MRPWIAATLCVAALAAGCGGDDSDRVVGGGANLFVQTADGGRFERSGKQLTLTLRPVSRVTATIADRPGRNTGTMTTSAFVGTFDEAFSDDPPNAIVSSLERGRGLFPVELSRPAYDDDTRTLSYDVRAIGGDGSELPDRVGPLSVFIDASGSNVTFVNNSNDAGNALAFVLTGRVVDENGDGVEGAVVTVRGGASAEPSGTTDTAGKYQVDGDLDVSEATVTVTATGFEDATAVANLFGMVELDFTLERSGG